MKILILCDYDKSIGYGHLCRCLALKAGFNYHKFFPTLIINGYANYLFKENSKTKSFRWIKNQQFLATLETKWDLIILDSYRITNRVIRKINTYTKTIGVFDDENKTTYPVDLIINGNIYAKTLKYKKREDSILLLGAKYAPLRRTFWKINRKPISNTIKNILISLGGSDESNLLLRLVKSLLKKDKKFKLFIIITDNYKQSAFKQIKKNPAINIFVSPTPNKIKYIMSNSDIAISGSGQTLNELACIGIPTISIIFDENQKMNAISWEEAGFLRIAGSKFDSNIHTKILEQIDLMDKLILRKRMSIIGRSLISGGGAKNIARSIINTYDK